MWRLVYEAEEIDAAERRMNVFGLAKANCIPRMGSLRRERHVRGAMFFAVPRRLEVRNANDAGKPIRAVRT